MLDPPGGRVAKVCSRRSLRAKVTGSAIGVSSAKVSIVFAQEHPHPASP